MHNSLTKTPGIGICGNGNGNGYAFRQSDELLWKSSEMKLINNLLLQDLSEGERNTEFNGPKNGDKQMIG